MKSKIFISYARRDYDVVIKLRDEIDGLREQADWKRKKGLDDKQEFKQASELLAERKRRMPRRRNFITRYYGVLANNDVMVILLAISK